MRPTTAPSLKERRGHRLSLHGVRFWAGQAKLVARSACRAAPAVNFKLTATAMSQALQTRRASAPAPAKTPQKRAAFAAGLKREAAAGKLLRGNAPPGPIVACVRAWGSGFWVFQGRAAKLS